MGLDLARVKLVGLIRVFTLVLPVPLDIMVPTAPPVLIAALMEPVIRD